MPKILNIRFLSSLMIALLSVCVSSGQACPTGVYTNTQTGWGLAAHAKKEKEKKTRLDRQQTAEKLERKRTESVAGKVETETTGTAETKKTETPEASESNNSNSEISK